LLLGSGRSSDARLGGTGSGFGLSAEALTAQPAPASRRWSIACCGPGAQAGGDGDLPLGPAPVRTTASDCEIRGGEYVLYDRADTGSALKVWLPQAEAGDKAAQATVGEIYEKGMGLPPDYALAPAGTAVRRTGR